MKDTRNAEQNFLSKLSVIEYKYRILDLNNEQFNIFTALHKQNDEVHLHSRFLSVLLSPISKHKKRDIFLKLFLKTVLIEDFDIEGIEVFPTENEKSEYKEIDILIINQKKRQAIIIENKIGACDSNHDDRGQLEGYFDLIQRIDKIPANSIKTFYLTVDRHEPSPESLGKYISLERINGRTIDYEHEITDWLNLCLKETADQPFLRESIIQYLNLIQHMTNNSNRQERLEIRDLIASSQENMESTRLLINNFKHVKWHTVREFWNELKEELIKAGFEILKYPTDNNITDTTHFESYKKDYNSKNDYGIKFKVENGLVLWVWNGLGEDWLYWGASKSELSIENQENIKKYCFDFPNNFKSSASSFIWKYFELPEEKNIYFPNFGLSGTFNLINKNYRTIVINNILIPEIINFIENLKTLTINSSNLSK